MGLCWTHAVCSFKPYWWESWQDILWSSTEGMKDTLALQSKGDTSTGQWVTWPASALSSACLLLPAIKPVLIKVIPPLILKLASIRIPPAHLKTNKYATTILHGGVDTLNSQNQAACAKFVFCSLRKIVQPVQVPRSSLMDLLKLIFPEAQVPFSKVQH